MYTLTTLENGNTLIADVTLYAGNEMLIVSMDEFAGLTKAVDCNDDDGKMSLTFKSSEIYDQALKTWSSINLKDDDKFLLVANHPGCGPEDDRQPYIVSRISEDTKDWTVILSATPADWSEVAVNFDLDFGKTSGAPASPPNKRCLRNCEDDKTFSIPLNLLNANDPHQIYNDSHVDLECTNCYLQGQLEVEGHLSVKDFIPRVLSMKATPHGIQGKLDFSTTVSAPTGFDIKKSVPLFSGPIPGLPGIAIGKWINVGVTAQYDVGADIHVEGDAKFDFGLDVSVPDTAYANLAIFGGGNTHAEGFTGDFTHRFNVDEVAAEVLLTVYSQPTVTVGFDIAKIGKVDVDLGLSLPEFTTDFVLKSNEESACADSKTGADITLKARVALDVNAKGEVAGHSIPGLPWSKNIFQLEKDLADWCAPIGKSNSTNTHQPRPQTQPLPVLAQN